MANEIFLFCNICYYFNIITFLSQENHWDLFSGAGCQSCACDSQGSTGAGCDLYTGQCECRAGVSGRSCDQCTPGFYDFTDLGCRGEITIFVQENNSNNMFYTPINTKKMKIRIM